MPARDEARALAGVGVLVTRAARQAGPLCEALERCGARVLRLPLIRIAPPSDPNAAQARLAELGAPACRPDLVILVSANALRFAAELLPEVAGHLRGVTVACLGEATASALRDAGLEPDLMPESGSTSEDLLALTALAPAAVSGRRVVIVKGEGGRDALARALAERGAEVEPIDTYRRLPPDQDVATFLDRHRDDLDIAIVTSGEALEALVERARSEQVRDLPLVLPSERVRARARALGLRGPVELPGRMSDAALAEAAARLAAVA